MLQYGQNEVAYPETKNVDTSTSWGLSTLASTASDKDVGVLVGGQLNMASDANAVLGCVNRGLPSRRKGGVSH